MQDVIVNGNVSGDVGDVLLANNFDVNALRPYIGSDGRSYVTQNGTAVPTNNAATLRKDDWIQLDTAILRTAKERLRVVADLRGAGLQYSLPNGMAHTVLQTETVSDISPATISMDGVRRGEADRPEFGLVNLPLPIIHKDFHFTTRQIMASRNGGSPLDTTTAELAARRVAEKAESYVLGLEDAYGYGGGSVYGMTNFPQRGTKTITSPTGSNNATVLSEVLEMIEQARAANHYGPFMLYCSPNWDQFMENDYNVNYPAITLRDRLRQITQVSDVRTVDLLEGSTYHLILVEQSTGTIRVVVGMDVTTVQWESHGGMMKHFKVMTIMVPQLRTDNAGQTGIVHGSV